jgi:hypothetical protein
VDIVSGYHAFVLDENDNIRGRYAFEAENHAAAAEFARKHAKNYAVIARQRTYVIGGIENFIRGGFGRMRSGSPKLAASS